MSIATACPECKHNFILPDNLMGKRIKCKNCAAVFRVGAENEGRKNDEFDTMAEMAPGATGDDFATQFPLRGEGHKGDDFATQFPLRGDAHKGDDFGTQPPQKANKDDFATQYPLKQNKDEFATQDAMHRDDFATNFAMKKGEPGWDGVEPPTRKGDQHFGASDTQTEWDEPAVPGAARKPSADDTVADAPPIPAPKAPGANDTAADYLPEPKPPGLTQLPPEPPKVPIKGKLIGAGLPKGPTKPVKLPGKGPAAKPKLPGAEADKTDLGRRAPDKVAPAGAVSPAKKGVNKLVLALLVFLLLDVAAFAAVVYLPEVRKAVGLNDQPWLNDIARNVGGHVDEPAKPPIVPANNTPELAQPTPDEPKPVEPQPEQPKPEPEQPTPEPEQPKPEPEQPKPEPELPKPEPEQPKPEPEQPKPEPEQPKPEPEQPKPEPEQPKPEPEQPKPEPEQPKPEPEQPKPEPEQPKPEPEQPKPEPEEPKPVEPLPMPEPPKPEVKEPEVDPFKSDWPKFERKPPAPAKPGQAKDYFNENFSSPIYDWKWLPAGTRAAAPKPGVAGALEVDANKQFHMQGSVADGEIRLTIWRDMSDADRRVNGEAAKSYEVQFRYVNANDYHALQVRGDGHYRIVRVGGGKTTTLVGDSKGDYLPLPRWDRFAEYDEVVLNFRGTNVFGMFGGKRLGSTDKAGEAAGKVGVRTLNGLAIAIEKMDVNE